MRLSRVVPGVLAVGVVGAGAAFVVGMRNKSPWLQDRIRAFSKQFASEALKTAGNEGAANGVVIHVGRRSGREYATPVTPLPTADGFVINLPYTSKVDWVQNVLAANSATIVHDGVDHRVTDPRVVPYAEVASMLPKSAGVVRAVFDIQEFLRVTTVD
ncbi:deazaflavin-dependent oxidoreductase (nitroreductase family) [Nocardioides albertanoniae]|uniref:Deazaflavin-dependent oxidoreductase (Nitroreductase family) n=1 Tax=Nocardioides albertanoniae TaxID=1175486 RepID=A0A543ADL6_9ACTN|nr:nitroreductase [Nocardioides albertanoniae]TQL70677.1 deazaflavin-dependent oxidoreductase (nitroreductase family) [Nocardioides albertanoniae]